MLVRLRMKLLLLAADWEGKDAVIHNIVELQTVPCLDPSAPTAPNVQLCERRKSHSVTLIELGLYLLKPEVFSPTQVMWMLERLSIDRQVQPPGVPVSSVYWPTPICSTQALKNGCPLTWCNTLSANMPTLELFLQAMISRPFDDSPHDMASRFFIMLVRQGLQN